MPAVVDACDAVIAVINAASLAGDFPRPVTAIEDHAISIVLEDTHEFTVKVQPGSTHRETGTLDGGVSEITDVRLVFSAAPVLCNPNAVREYLKLIELICDTIESDIGQSYIFLGADHDGDQLYDQNRLRGDAVFCGELTIKLSSLRYTA